MQLIASERGIARAACLRFPQAGSGTILSTES
jgi:hypothetical protein